MTTTTFIDGTTITSEWCNEVDAVVHDVLGGATTDALARTALGVAIGTDVQAYSANLDEYAAVNPTAAGLALLDDADATTQLTTLGGTTVGKNLFTAVTAAAAQQAMDTEVGVDVQAYAATASQAEMITGTETALRSMSPLLVRQSAGATITHIVTNTGATLYDITPASTTVRFEIYYSSVSTNGTSPIVVQLNPTGTPGYESAGSSLTAAAVATINSATGLLVCSAPTAATSFSGIQTLRNVEGALWLMASQTARDGAAVAFTASGMGTAGAALTKLRVTTSGGANTFDNGDVYIYEFSY